MIPPVMLGIPDEIEPAAPEREIVTAERVVYELAYATLAALRCGADPADPQAAAEIADHVAYYLERCEAAGTA